MKTLEEIQARLAQIATEAESATGDVLDALETEQRSLLAELDTITNEARRKQDIRDGVARGLGVPMKTPALPDQDAERTAAEKFAKSGRMQIGVDQARAVLVSGGTLATPTAVAGINDIPGAKVSSIIDLCKVVNCNGMGKNRIAYVAADADTAATQTEGNAATAKEPTFAYIEISPTSVAATAQISKQAKKQSPLQYSAKVREQSLLALRKKAAAIATASLKASSLVATATATVASSKGVVDDKTLRMMAMAYGGDESLMAGTLFLNKTDLIAFGDVRGTNEKKAVYEITPNAANPNTGIIKDGGLSVPYVINSGLTACSGTSQTASAQKTMFFGDPQCLELDLFSDYEIRVSEDFAITSLMDTIVGDVELGSDVVVKNGFVALVIPATAG